MRRHSGSGVKLTRVCRVLAGSEQRWERRHHQLRALQLSRRLVGARAPAKAGLRHSHVMSYAAAASSRLRCEWQAATLLQPDTALLMSQCAWQVMELLTVEQCRASNAGDVPSCLIHVSCVIRAHGDDHSNGNCHCEGDCNRDGDRGSRAGGRWRSTVAAMVGCNGWLQRLAAVGRMGTRGYTVAMVALTGTQLCGCTGLRSLMGLLVVLLVVLLVASGCCAWPDVVRVVSIYDNS